MLHHISFAVSHLETSATLYDAMLHPLGYRRVCEGTGFVGYGVTTNKDKFALKQRMPEVAAPSPGFHLAFAAPSREAVDLAYAAALAHGGKDNGPPGLREHFGPQYYAAFVIDPDGYALELVINTR